MTPKAELLANYPAPAYPDHDVPIFTRHWPGCRVKVIEAVPVTDWLPLNTFIIEAGNGERWAVQDMALYHPQSEIVILFQRDIADIEIGQPPRPDVTILGAGLATNKEIRARFPLLQRLRVGAPAGRPGKKYYDRMFARLQAGESWDSLRVECLAEYDADVADLLRRALQYRERKKR